MNSIAINSSYSLNQRLFCPERNPYQRTVPYVLFSIFRAKSKKRPFCVSFSLPIRPQNGVSNFNQSLPINPFSLLSPILQNMRNFTAKAAKFKWGSCLQDPAMVHYFGCDVKPPILLNGGLGMALLTVKSTARDRFSPIIAALATNPTFVSGLFACFLAQWMKVVLNFFVERKWDIKIMCTSGGMPSSHSALCTALTTSVAICHGIADSLFPVCLGFSLIVMYDAIGVRRHAGMQAQVNFCIIYDLERSIILVGNIGSCSFGLLFETIVAIWI